MKHLIRHGSGNGSRRAACSALLSLTTIPVLAGLAPDAPRTSSGSAKTPSVSMHPESTKAPWAAPAKTGAPQPGLTAGAVPHAAKAADALPAALQGQLSPINRDMVYFDQPGDGSLWARGKTYKMSFDSGVATYVPYLGADAPQNYPVSFQLQGVSVGQAAVAFDADAAATLADHTVSIDRGSFVENYHLTPQSVEQTWVFDQLPAGGDLTVEVAVSTQMSRGTAADSLRFSNEHGVVSYTKAVVLDAAGQRVPAPTVMTEDGIKITVSAAFLKSAAYPITIDPVVTTFDVHVGEADSRVPDIAFEVTNNRYLISYEDAFSATDGDVFAELRTAGGALVASSGEFIDFTEDNWRNPKCASNNLANQFLVVAEVGNAPTRIIRGRTRLASSPVTMGPQFTISAADQTGDKLNPDVGGDPTTAPPTHYCVVWERVFSGTDRDVHGRMVNTDSTLLGGATILIDDSSDTIDRNPSVSKSDGALPFGTQRYTVVWQRTFEPGDEDIRGAQLTWDGVIQTPSFSIDFASDNDQFPTVSSVLDAATGTRSYLVAYTRGASGNQSIVGTVLNEDDFITSENLTTLGAFTPGMNQILPSADSDGSKFAVAAAEEFEEGTPDFDVYISTLCFSGTRLSLAESFQNLAFSGSTESQVQVTSIHSGGGGATRFGAVWRDAGAVGAGALGNIEAGLYDTAPPNNNSCINAPDIGTGTFTGSVFCATGDGSASCGSSNGNADVWYSFTAPGHGLLRVDTCGTHDAPGINLGMDTVLSLRNNNCGGAELECNDDWDDSDLPSACAASNSGVLRDSFVQTEMLAGHTVLIRVSHFDTVIADGQFILHVNFQADPCAADFNNDGTINGIDLGILLNAFSIPAGSPGCGGAFNCSPDLNGDGLVNGIDLGILLLNFAVPAGSPCA